MHTRDPRNLKSSEGGLFAGAWTVSLTVAFGMRCPHDTRFTRLPDIISARDGAAATRVEGQRRGVEHIALLHDVVDDDGRADFSPGTAEALAPAEHRQPERQKAVVHVERTQHRRSDRHTALHFGGPLLRGAVYGPQPHQQHVAVDEGDGWRRD